MLCKINLNHYKGYVMRTIFKHSLFVFLFFTFFSTLLFAETQKITSSMTTQELNKLTASDGEAGDKFGYSVAISGDTAIVGAYGDDDAGSTSGSAYIFERNLTTGLFEQRAKLITSDSAKGDLFGYSVAISGDTAIVGAYGDDDAGSTSGSAYIFEKPVSGWATSTQSAKLTASDAESGDRFGRSVAISGNTAIVGAYHDDCADSSIYCGSAYIFEKPVSGWSDANQSAKLTASDREAYDYFGDSVAISGNTAIVGAFSDDDAGSDSGSAYLFEKPVSGWATSTQSAKLTASDAESGDYFGHSVAISGDTAIVGAYRDDNYLGSAYIFEKSLLGWATVTENAKLTASDGAEGDYFGYSVSISGDIVIVGSPFDNAVSDSAGSAYLFEKPASEWVTATENAKLTASDGAAVDAFGYSVAISNDTTLAGAYYDDCVDGSDDCGSAYIFKLNSKIKSFPWTMFLPAITSSKQ